MICDAGPLVALLDENDANLEQCIVTVDSRPPEPFFTTVACLAEAYYLLWRKGGIEAQDNLSAMIANGEIEILDVVAADFERIRELMRQFSDLPMDFADATIVTLAERLVIKTVFTLDHHFRIYRPRGFDLFDVVP